MLNTKEGKGEGEGFNSLVFFFHSSSLQNGKLLFLDLTMIAAKKKKIIWLFVFFPFGLSSLIQKKKFLDVIFNIPYRIIPVLKS